MKTYVIAEIGINHNGILENCFKLIEAASDAGCQAAKFQSFSAKNLYPKSAGKLDWKDDKKKYSYDIYDAVKSFEMPLEWVDPLMQYCEKKNIDFMSSVFDVEGLNYLVEKGMKRIKLSSYTITHIPLIEAAAKTGLPLVMSTGGSKLAEVEEAVETVLKHHNNLILLHCSIQYPTKLEDVHMGVLDTFKHAFPDLKYGYSDHTIEPSDAPVQAIYLGGDAIEKHITLDKKMEGPDHFFALEPDELKEMCMAIAEAEQNVKMDSIFIRPEIYGSSAKICHEHERYLRDFAYMSMFSKRDISKGDRIDPDDIAILRPGKKRPGLLPKYFSLFEQRKVLAKKDMKQEDPITWDCIIG